MRTGGNPILGTFRVIERMFQCFTDSNQATWDTSLLYQPGVNVVTRWLPFYFQWNNLICFRPKLSVQCIFALEANFMM